MEIEPCICGVYPDIIQAAYIKDEDNPNHKINIYFISSHCEENCMAKNNFGKKYEPNGEVYCSTFSEGVETWNSFIKAEREKVTFEEAKYYWTNLKQACLYDVHDVHVNYIYKLEKYFSHHNRN